MSLTKKDPSLRVAANDPHLVSLGGGRLSTAVTIHYIPIGDTTIGSSSNCSIPLNGSGVRATHCTIYRSEQNEVTIVPENDARILIDGTKITEDTNLTQGAMITIGNSNYLRFNNPAEAQLIRSAMGSNERVSMPQIDFTQVPQHNFGSASVKTNINSPEICQSLDIERFYMAKINPLTNTQMSMDDDDDINIDVSKMLYDNVPSSPIDINGLQCPKVFTADSVTVNMPAKDVLGQKYANFAKNLAENHRNDKNVSNATLRNNQVKIVSQTGGQTSNATSNYINIPSNSRFMQNNNNNSSSNSGNGGGSGGSGSSMAITSSTSAARAQANGEYLVKVNNTSMGGVSRSVNAHVNNHITATAYDRYPKPGSYGGMQIYPMNGINTEINNGSPNSTPLHNQSQQRSLSHLSNTDSDCLEEMLKKCTEYADRQNQSASSSITSSPVVQNRIKTNGSLPREKKSPFYFDHSAMNTSPHVQQSLPGSSNSSNNTNYNLHSYNSLISNTSSGYENVRLVGQNFVEINGQLIGSSPKSGYENVVMGGKYVPQSPRTKIRTNCLSPKKEHNFSGLFGQTPPHTKPQPPPKPCKQSEYDQLIRTFEEKLKLEMQAIEESSRYQPTNTNSISRVSSSEQNTPAKRVNKNINNLMLNLHKQSHSLQNSPKLSKKPAPAPRHFINAASSVSGAPLQCITVTSSEIVKREATIKTLRNSQPDLMELKRTRKELIANIQALKREMSELQRQEDESLRELHLEKALVSAELNSVRDAGNGLMNELEILQLKIHRLEAQRNSTRVMEENQQAKLKQSIEMKQDQIRKLKSMLKEKPNNDCLKEELTNVCESLENDRKTFEDLEFQYLEEESEWHAYREELHAEEKGLAMKIEEKQLELHHLEKQDLTNQSTANMDVRTLKHNLITLISEFNACQERLKTIENHICDITGELHINSSDEDETDSNMSPFQSNLGAGIMSQSLFGSAEMLCPKHTSDDIMSKSVNENMFYNNKIELPRVQGPTAVTSTPKRSQLQVVRIDDDALLDEAIIRTKANDVDIMSENERVKFNLSLGSDDFEVNPLEKRVPSQDDIDRISKVTIDAPISTKGATSKIFDSIKEIERNRKLLLAQQGHHVIEHERQKMHDLKKKSHDEARAQYISMLSGNDITDKKCSRTAVKNEFVHELQQLNVDTHTNNNSKNSAAPVIPPKPLKKKNTSTAPLDINEYSDQQRLSQPEFETQIRPLSHNSPRPLSDATSELNCEDLLTDNNTCKSNNELSTPTTCSSGIGSVSETQQQQQQQQQQQHFQQSQQQLQDDSIKRSSVNSMSSGGGSTNGTIASSGERKRVLPKHQRPLTRYLPIFSPDLNLRHHIESAGHQIALCPHVFIDAYSCRGYLHKLGATFHGWARRWFVLDRQRSAFIYYSDKSERKPRGGAYFSTIDEVYLDHLNASKSGRPHCTFIVKTKKRSYHLQAASDAAARIWIDAIITGAQGNLDY